MAAALSDPFYRNVVPSVLTIVPKTPFAEAPAYPPTILTYPLKKIVQ